MGTVTICYNINSMKEEIFFNSIRLKKIRRTLRRKATPAEQMLWVFLRGNNFGIRFHRQLNINQYIVDFCCWKEKFIIEVDGKIHERPEIAEYDKVRENDLKKLGFKILRFSNDEVMNNPTHPYPLL